MTTIRVQCAACTTVTDVPTGALLVSPADSGDTPTSGLDGTGGTAMWVCPGCGELVATRVSAPLVDALCATGVDLLDTDYTDPRPLHPENPAGGAMFTPDDLLSLHEQLDTDAWFTALTNTGCGQS